LPLRRHARRYAGHPRLNGIANTKDSDGRDKPGHDDLGALGEIGLQCNRVIASSNRPPADEHQRSANSTPTVRGPASAAR